MKCSEADCVKEAWCRGMCQVHYMKMYKKGEGIKRQTSRQDISVFIENLKTAGEACVNWPFKQGRSNTCINGKPMAAARYICIVFHGEPPSSIHQAAHSCGNGDIGCVNPNHVRWATPIENTDDAFKHGDFALGSRHGKSKLTEKDIPEIRKLREEGLSLIKIASMFSVGPSTIHGIVNGETWSHVP